MQCSLLLPLLSKLSETCESHALLNNLFYISCEVDVQFSKKGLSGKGNYLATNLFLFFISFWSYLCQWRERRNSSYPKFSLAYALGHSFFSTTCSVNLISLSCFPHLFSNLHCLLFSTWATPLAPAPHTNILQRIVFVPRLLCVGVKS